MELTHEVLQRLKRQVYQLDIDASLTYDGTLVERIGNTAYRLTRPSGKRENVGARNMRAGRAVVFVVFYLTGVELDAPCARCGCAVPMRTSWCHDCRSDAIAAAKRQARLAAKGIAS